VVLYEFIAAHREELIARTRAKVAERLVPKASEGEIATGVPLFLDQLAETLRDSPTSRGDTIERGAALHGAALLGLG
jgi:hypothetical protein